MRRILCLFLLIVLPLQSIAMQGGVLPTGKTFDLAHELDHAQNTSHHHDDDGSVHYDDSDESKQHANDYSSCCQQTAAISSAHVPSLDIPSSLEKAIFITFDIRDGFPERPQRPPSTLG